MMADTAGEKRLAKYRRYNSSSKGQRRDARYEAKHPERRLRWSLVTGRDVAAVAAAVVLPDELPQAPADDE